MRVWNSTCSLRDQTSEADTIPDDCIFFAVFKAYSGDDLL